MDRYEYHDCHQELSDSERLAWLTKNWASNINSQDVQWLCELAAKGLERAPPGAKVTTAERNLLAYLDMVDRRDLSACCTAPTDPDVLICGQCGEHCDLLPEQADGPPN